MKQLRLWVTLLLGWFFLFYNLERLSEPINIASFVYILVAALALTIILLPQVQRLPLLVMFTCSFALFFVLKVWLGYEIGGKNLPVTVTESGAIALTLVLAKKVASLLKEFQEAVLHVMISHFTNLSHPFEKKGQGAMYREIRRARMNERPLAVLAISASNEAVESAMDRFIEEVQQNNMKKYVVAQIADFLSKEIRDYDLLARRNNHFISLLPGISRQEINGIVQDLERLAKEKLGLSLNIGVATFPEEVTFEKLVECAERNMAQPDPSVEGVREEVPSGVKATT